VREHGGDLVGRLADGTPDAEDVVLVAQGIQGQRGLAGLPITQDQFALAATDGDQGVDDLDPGLQGSSDRRSAGQPGRVPLDRAVRLSHRRGGAVQ